MKKKNFSRSTLALAIITLITLLVWAGFDIYRAYTKTQVKPDIRNQMTPINPKLNTEALKKLEQSRNISVEEINSLKSVSLLKERPEATESALPTQATTSSEEVGTSF